MVVTSYDRGLVCACLGMDVVMGALAGQNIPIVPDDRARRALSAERGGPVLNRLSAVILLAGSVRATDLTQSIGRSLLDLPLDDRSSLLSSWYGQTNRLAEHARLSNVPLRVMMDRDAVEPTAPTPLPHSTISIERDQLEYRGTGGVLKDLSGSYGEDAYILVANAAQVLLDDLTEIAASMAHQNGDVVIVSHRDGAPSGLMLLRCAALRGIASAGFVDMKEQALTAIARHWRVKVLHRESSGGLTVRTLSDYITALRRLSEHRNGARTSLDPYAEDWQPAFRVIEQNEDVSSAARIHDSVILRGAVVEAGATVVRSVVCRGAVLRKGSMTIEKIVSPEAA